MILLDTCALLWLVDDQTRLSTRALKLISENGDLLCVSAITAFEIGVKCQTGRLILPLPPEEWFGRALEQHGLLEQSVTWKIACRSTELPPLHKDPCDRILVATAQLSGMTLLTPDHLITAYPGVNVDW